MSPARGNPAGASFSNGNGQPYANGPTAGSGCGVIPDSEWRACHWWTL